jgi:hypothetical protein
MLTLPPLVDWMKLPVTEILPVKKGLRVAGMAYRRRA